MADFYNDVLHDILPEYRLFKKRYSKLHADASDDAQKKHLEDLRTEFDQLVKILKRPERIHSLN